MKKPKFSFHKTAAVLQLVATGALTAVASDPALVPPQYRLGVIVAMGAMQALMPSPVKRSKKQQPAAE